MQRLFDCEMPADNQWLLQDPTSKMGLEGQRDVPLQGAGIDDQSTDGKLDELMQMQAFLSGAIEKELESMRQDISRRERAGRGVAFRERDEASRSDASSSAPDLGSASFNTPSQSPGMSTSSLHACSGIISGTSMPTTPTTTSLVTTVATTYLMKGSIMSVSCSGYTPVSRWQTSERGQEAWAPSNHSTPRDAFRYGAVGSMVQPREKLFSSFPDNDAGGTIQEMRSQTTKMMGPTEETRWVPEHQPGQQLGQWVGVPRIDLTCRQQVPEEACPDSYEERDYQISNGFRSVSQDSN